MILCVQVALSAAALKYFRGRIVTQIPGLIPSGEVGESCLPEQQHDSRQCGQHDARGSVQFIKIRSVVLHIVRAQIGFPTQRTRTKWLVMERAQAWGRACHTTDDINIA